MPLPEEDMRHVPAHTREAWDAPAGKRLFVTGGTGFSGSSALEEIFPLLNREDLTRNIIVPYSLRGKK